MPCGPAVPYERPSICVHCPRLCTAGCALHICGLSVDDGLVPAVASGGCWGRCRSQNPLGRKQLVGSYGGLVVVVGRKRKASPFCSSRLDPKARAKDVQQGRLIPAFPSAGRCGCGTRLPPAGVGWVDGRCIDGGMGLGEVMICRCDCGPLWSACVPVGVLPGVGGGYFENFPCIFDIRTTS